MTELQKAVALSQVPLMTVLQEAKASGQVLLMDGAMGTEIQRAGISAHESYEAWNLTHPDKIRGIHQAYVDAGARLILTNTFQLNPISLAKAGIQDSLDNICQAALTLARLVCPLVLADVGPLPPEVISNPEIRTLWLDSLGPCLRTADGIFLETFSDGGGLQLGELLTQSDYFSCQTPVLLSFTFLKGKHGLQTLDGLAPEEIASQAQYGISALGVNCGRDIDMSDILEIIQRYRQATDLPLLARPNAGTPARMGDCWVYPHTPEKMASRLPELLEAGITMVGGCCGTTPAHIAAFRPIVDQWNAQHTTREEQP
jgi:methionine synthase I (cobalamin-dependent)